MLKHSWFQRTLTKATPLQREIAQKTFNTLWTEYHQATEQIRRLWQERKIGVTQYREATKARFKELRQELKARLEVVI